MLTIDIPGRDQIRAGHLVLDYNGTIALDGALLPGVAERITALAARLAVHVLTADTHMSCAGELAGLPVTISVVAGAPEDAAKLAYVRELGAASCICIGNGMNDRHMLESCGLGIAVVGDEGAALRACAAADLVAPGIIQALDLLIQDKRLLATLRN